MSRKRKHTLKAQQDVTKICFIEKVNIINCEHIIWLQSVDQKESQLYDEDWMKWVLEKLSRLSEQCFSIILFVEQKIKNTVLYKLFSFNNIKWDCCDEFANL